jgi:hypothetical protein
MEEIRKERGKEPPQKIQREGRERKEISLK